MKFALTNVDVFLLTSAVVSISWIYVAHSSLRKRSNDEQLRTGQQAASRPASQWGIRSLLAVFVAFHTVYILYKLIVHSPQNIFTLLHLRLNEPAENIRLALMRQARVNALPSSVDSLLTRLQSFDARVAYVRFGHAVVQDCDHCTSFNDFALYALPQPLLEYARMATVIGIVTIQGSGREHLRFWALAFLALAAVGELYFVLATEVSFSPGQGKTLMIHDVCLRARRIIFLLLPPPLYIIPSRRPLSPIQALPGLVSRLERTRALLQLLNLTSAARSRHPTLRASADAWWTEQREDGRYAVNDHALQEMASEVGIALAEKHGERHNSSLRGRARAVVEAMHPGLRLGN